jgi:geranylgeranyl diphosphate synthase type II
VDVHAYFREQIPLIDQELAAAIPPASQAPADLHAAMRHILFPGGKRLRPVLAMSAAEAVGAPPTRALPMAVAVELVHTYSLIHDDLPCMDDDDERRGVPSVHVAFGEAVAVLAGDALLAAAFEVLAGSGGDASADQRLAAMRELARAAGSLQLVGGQVDDLDFDRATVDAAAIESIHARKSAALIAASIAGGAHLAGADRDTVDRLQRCGLATGVAFQIADDVLDAGEDDPCSMVRVLGLDPSRRRAEELLAVALGELDGLGEKAEPLRQLVEFAVRRSV